MLPPEEQERMKLSVCRFFEGKLNELEAVSGSDSMDYVQKFYELCTATTVPWSQKKEFDLLGLPAPLRIRFDRNSAYQPELRKMSVSVEPLLQARNVSDLKEASLTILQAIYHEAEHIFFPIVLEEYEGADRGTTPGEWIQYASQDTEINSYARQYAFRYSREYPNEPFALDKMQELAVRLSNEREAQNDAYNYFIVFADSDKQREYGKWGDLAKAHAAIVAETEKQLMKISQRV